MSAEKFGHSAVAHNTVPVSAAAIRQGGMVAGGVPVVPTNASLHAVDRPVNPSTLPKQTARPEHFFTRNQPTTAVQPFHEQAAQVQQAIQQHQEAVQTMKAAGSAPAESTATQRSSVSANAAAQAVAGRPATTPAPAATSRPVAPAPSSTGDRQGWHRFGAATTTPNEHAAPQPTTRIEPQRSAAPRASAATVSQSPAESRRPVQSSGNSSGWHKFSASPRTTVPESRAPQQPRETNRPATPTPVPAPRAAAAPQSSGWAHFSPQPESRQSSRAETPANNSSPRIDSRPEPRTEYRPAPRMDSRPPLDLHRSIVTPRSYPSYGESRGGGYSSGSRSGGYYGGARSSVPMGSRGSSGGASYGGGSHGGSGSRGSSSSSGSSSSHKGSSGPHGRG